MSSSELFPKVSVLVPCYNVEKFIGECLDSLCKQTLSDIHIVCIDDGSTDNTLSIIRSFAEKDNRIEVITKSNSGYGDSMNIGLSHCRGEYIGIVESDDFVDASMYEELYSVAKKDNLDIARSGYYVYKNGKDVLERRSQQIPKNCILKPLEVTPIFFRTPAIWSAIYRKSWLKENNIQFLPTPGASFQDRSFSFKTNYCCDRFEMIDKCFLHYRQHGGNSVLSTGKVYCICDEWNEIVRFVGEKHKNLSELSHILIPVCIKNFRWNYRRIQKQDKLEFLKRCSMIFKDWAVRYQLKPNEKISKLTLWEYQTVLNNPQYYGLFLKFKHLVLRHFF